MPPHVHKVGVDLKDNDVLYISHYYAHHIF